MRFSLLIILSLSLAGCAAFRDFGSDRSDDTFGKGIARYVK